MPRLRDVILKARDFKELEFKFLNEIFRRSLYYERVPLSIISKRLKLKEDKVIDIARELHSLGLVEYFGQPYPSARLQTLGADILALHKLAQRRLVVGLGRQIGVGKEADVYEVFSEDTKYILKFFRIGRISFRQVRRVRDYGKNDVKMSWLYRNISAAKKEFSMLSRLYIQSLPVPRPIFSVMHTVLMEYLDGFLLKDIDVSPHVKDVFNEIIESIYAIYSYGFVNGDISEYNIMVLKDGTIKIIDWPQSVRVSDPRAPDLLKRDLLTISKYFMKKYDLSKQYIVSLLDKYGLSRYIDDIDDF